MALNFSSFQYNCWQTGNERNISVSVHFWRPAFGGILNGQSFQFLLMNAPNPANRVGKRSKEAIPSGAWDSLAGP